MSDEPEQFNIIKLVSSPFTGLFWIKCLMFGLGIACLIFIGYGVYGYYFKVKPPSTTQNAEQIVNPSIEPKTYFGGCASTRVYQYFQKEKIFNDIGNRVK